MKKVLTLGAVFAATALIVFGVSCKKDDASDECCTIVSGGTESKVCKSAVEADGESWDEFKESLAEGAKEAAAAGIDYYSECK